MMQRMNSIPATREEFERNLFLMTELIRRGKFCIHPRVPTPFAGFNGFENSQTLGSTFERR